MFNSTLATQEEEIELPDVEVREKDIQKPKYHPSSEALNQAFISIQAASFLALLRFLYSDEVQIGPDSVMTTLYTGKLICSTSMPF